MKSFSTSSFFLRRVSCSAFSFRRASSPRWPSSLRNLSRLSAGPSPNKPGKWHHSFMWGLFTLSREASSDVYSLSINVATHKSRELDASEIQLLRPVTDNEQHNLFQKSRAWKRMAWLTDWFPTCAWMWKARLTDWFPTCAWMWKARLTDWFPHLCMNVKG